jgi:hypothetical protein
MKKERIHKGILMQTDVVNKNKRIYPKHIVEKALEIYEENIKNKSSYGELEHPESFVVSLDKSSHIVTDVRFRFPKVPRKKKKKLKKEGKYNHNTVVVKYKLLDGQFGELAKKIIGDLVPSPRGIGSLDKDGVVSEDYQLIAVDLIRKETKA